MKVGIFGGRFDPIHIGHLILARDVAEHVGLDKVLFLLSYTPPHKEVSLSFDNRLRLLKAALDSEPDFEACTIERELALKKSYTAIVLEKLSQTMPQDNLFFIVGEDQFEKFNRWYKPKKIFQIAHVVVLKRHERGTTTSFLSNVLYVNKRIIEISSTEIRDRIKKGLPIHHLVPHNVAKIIEAEKFYTQEENRGGSHPEKII